MRYFLVLAFLLSGCGGYDSPEAEQTTQGVMVTDNVPHSTETIQDIIDRGPFPPRDNTAIPSHRIHR
jgi:PBP1b-binding outer membrane lipoprotein LpoB